MTITTAIVVMLERMVSIVIRMGESAWGALATNTQCGPLEPRAQRAESTGQSPEGRLPWSASGGLSDGGMGRLIEEGVIRRELIGEPLDLPQCWTYGRDGG